MKLRVVLDVQFHVSVRDLDFSQVCRLQQMNCSGYFFDYRFVGKVDLVSCAFVWLKKCEISFEERLTSNVTNNFVMFLELD